MVRSRVLWTREFLGPWGVLPLGLLLSFLLARALGRIFFSSRRSVARALGGMVLALALLSAGTRALGLAGLARGPWLLAFLAALTTLACWRARGARVLRPAPWLSLLSMPSLVIGASALLLSATAAYLMPVWQYDALGYHLPFVDFVIQSGSSRGVPSDARFIGTYPHSIEWIMVGLRSLLPDDRLIDVAQIPFGALGGLAVAGVARMQGASAPLSFSAGVTWLVMPAIFLQLPTNYVDVASASCFLCAAFFLSYPVSRASLAAAGCAIGLFLGAKPQAPIGAAALGTVLLVRAIRAHQAGWGALALGFALLLGAESYVVDWVRFGNPVWPVDVHFGPLHFAGPESMHKILSSGGGADHVEGSLLQRVARSWSALDAPGSFDMRRGGLSAAALVALFAAPFLVWQKRASLLLVFGLAALATPDPAVVRYVVALPGLALACGAAWLSDRSERVAMAGAWAVSVAAAWSLFRAVSGLSGEGPPLFAYLRLDWAEREIAVGPEGRPTDFVSMRDHLLPGEAVAFDETLDLPHAVWKPDLTTRGIYLASRQWADLDKDFFSRERVRYVIVADVSPMLSAASAPGLLLLFRCKFAPCSAYEVIR